MKIWQWLRRQIPEDQKKISRTLSKPNSNMKTALLSVSIFSLLAMAAQAQNVNIVWQTPTTISGASDVTTAGTYFGSWAPQDGSANTLPVNGVTFQGFSDLPGFTPGATFDNGYNGFGSPNTPDSNYNALLQYARFSNEGSSPATITWNGMTQGDVYLVELWVNDGRNIGQARSETLTGGSSTSASVSYGSDGSGPGQFIIGEFVADASGSETITLDGFSSGANPDPQVNLFQVRDLTPVPEPTTLALVAAGAGVMYCGFRRKSRV